ncbi:MAG TPA: response regulator transcription factor [Pyrinomonadaceae bacterium]|jgi:two-component system copper resistance phosphate regulon response regulator CusR
MRILIVEDDMRLAAVVSRGLRKHAYAVDAATDGEEGLFYAETNAYDLLILDVMLPKKNGFELCRELRENGSELPILMLTARDAVADRVNGLDSGADDYLIKPFDFDELLARVRALSRRRPVLLNEQIGVSDLILNRTTRTARRGQRTIELTTKEFALLEYLMENVGRVLTREQIAEHVWDINFDAFSNVIDVYVGRLRRKVDATTEAPLVHTRRGTGYLLSTTAPDENF